MKERLKHATAKGMYFDVMIFFSGFIEYTYWELHKLILRYHVDRLANQINTNIEFVKLIGQHRWRF